MLAMFQCVYWTWWHLMLCFFENSIPTTLKMIHRSFLIESRVAQQQVQNSKRISWAQPSACPQPKPPRGVTLLVDLLDFCAWFIPEVCGYDWSESEMLWSKWIHSSFWLSPWMCSAFWCLKKALKRKDHRKGCQTVKLLDSSRTTCKHILEPLSLIFCGNSRRFRCCFTWNGRLPPQSRNVELLVMIPLVFHLGLFFWVEKTDQKK